MEIERKFLLKTAPEGIESFPFHTISQGYISQDPVVRIRQLDNDFILTIKSRGLLKRTEIEKPLTEKEFGELSDMVIGNVIKKRRYILPLNDYPDLKVELDIFSGIFEGLIIAEVEFPDTEIARSFKAPDYLKLDVTDNPKYQNSSLSLMNAAEVSELLSASKLI